jgi:hypothetical protein
MEGNRVNTDTCVKPDASQPTFRAQHIADSVGYACGLVINDEFKAFSTDEFDCCFRHCEHIRLCIAQSKAATRRLPVSEQRTCTVRVLTRRLQIGSLLGAG